MLSFLLEIHFWTFDDGININDNDFGAFKYHFKRETCTLSFHTRKKLYSCNRGYKWNLSNKKSPKLKHNIKELEEIIESHRIVSLKWITSDLLVILFSSGTLAYVRMNITNGDISGITFDRILKDKLSSLHVSDFITTSVFSICCYNDPRITLIHYAKPSFKNIYRKMSDLEPRFISVNLPGPIGRRLYRKLSLNKSGDLISVWWKYSDDDVFPWSPLVKDIDRANIHIFHIDGSKVEFLCHHQTLHDVLSVTFSSIEPHILYVVEQKFSSEGNVYAEITTFEIIKCSRLQRMNVVSILLESESCCLDFSPDRNNLLLGCVNGSVVLYNQTRNITQIVRATFVPSIIRWHADGYLSAVGSAAGQIQCFDSALNDIEMQSLSEDIAPSSVIDLSTYFESKTNTDPPSLIEMEWNLKRVNSTDCQCQDGFLILSFAGGPLALLRIFNGSEISPDFLIAQYLQADRVDKAINFLLSMDWDTNPHVCCSLLKQLSNHILTSSSFSPNEKYSQLQVALSSFYSPVRPISISVETELNKPVKNISRRLFHYLLKHDLCDEAMTIANRLEEHDLFMDLFHYACTCDNSSLASIAWRKAEQILAEDAMVDPGSSSENCDCSCSDCSCESERHSDGSPETKDAEELPLPIVMSSSNRASFAAITRVNSTNFMNLGSTQPKRGTKEFSPDYPNESTSPVHSHILARARESSVVPNTATSLPNCSSSQSTQPISHFPSYTSIPNGVTKELLHQTGLSESKIKVVHFGVV